MLLFPGVPHRWNLSGVGGQRSDGAQVVGHSDDPSLRGSQGPGTRLPTLTLVANGRLKTPCVPVGHGADALSLVARNGSRTHPSPMACSSPSFFSPPLAPHVFRLPSTYRSPPGSLLNTRSMCNWRRLSVNAIRLCQGDGPTRGWWRFYKKKKKHEK